MIVVGSAGTHFSVPIEGETYLVELLAIAGNVLLCSDFGYLPWFSLLWHGPEAYSRLFISIYS